MGNFVLMIVIGLAVGTFMIALGGGGGAVYLGVLTAVFGLSPVTAAATSIITALPALALGAWSYYRRGLIDFHVGNCMLIAALPSVVVGYLISPWIPEKIYKLIIGVILAILGIQLIYKVYHQSPKSADTGGAHKQWASWGYGILAGLMVGIAGLSGGGPVTAGLLLLGVSMVRTSATSSYVLLGMSILGAILHLSGGHIDWQAAGGLIIGSLVGAALAPSVIIWLTKKPQRALIIKVLLGIMLIIMGIKTAI